MDIFYGEVVVNDKNDFFLVVNKQHDSLRCICKIDHNGHIIKMLMTVEKPYRVAYKQERERFFIRLAGKGLIWDGRNLIDYLSQKFKEVQIKQLNAISEMPVMNPIKEVKPIIY